MAAAEVLMVDDEPVLLDLMARYAARSGWRAAKALTAAEAWAMFSETPSRFPLAIVDLTLPDGSGEELVLRMLRMDPALRVVICTGLPYETDHLPAGIRGRVSVLMKPFPPSMLGAAFKTAAE